MSRQRHIENKTQTRTITSTPQNTAKSAHTHTMQRKKHGGTLCARQGELWAVMYAEECPPALRQAVVRARRSRCLFCAPLRSVCAAAPAQASRGRTSWTHCSAVAHTLLCDGARARPGPKPPRSDVCVNFQSGGDKACVYHVLCTRRRRPGSRLLPASTPRPPGLATSPNPARFAVFCSALCPALSPPASHPGCRRRARRSP